MAGWGEARTRPYSGGPSSSKIKALDVAFCTCSRQGTITLKIASSFLSFFLFFL